MEELKELPTLFLLIQTETYLIFRILDTILQRTAKKQVIVEGSNVTLELLTWLTG
jgi:hypothetical protein